MLQSLIPDEHRRLCPVLETKFTQDTLEMMSYRARRKAELAANLFIRRTSAHELQDFLLSPATEQ